MANHLDLEEQEQLDQLKHFWNQYGNLLTWLLIAVLGAYAGWTGYQAWQRHQANQAAMMFDEVEKIVVSGEVSKAERAFTDMHQRFASALQTQQAGLMVAKMAFDAKQMDSAKSALRWVIEHGGDAGYQSVARLRLASIQAHERAYDDALTTLSSGMDAAFAALAHDRRGDIYLLQGHRDKARSAYQAAYDAFGRGSDFRRLVTVKLNALGVNPELDGLNMNTTKGAA